MSDFLDMGGYAIFVWGSYGTAAVVLAWNWIGARVAHRRMLERLRRGRSS